MTPAELRPLPTLAAVPTTPVSPVQPAEPRLGLSLYDAAPIAALAPRDAAELVEDAKKLVDVLVNDGPAGRVRMLARCAAAARVQQRVLEELLAAALHRRDERGFALVERALRGAERRLLGFTKLLAEEETRRRPAVVIRQAGQVNVSGGP